MIEFKALGMKAEINDLYTIFLLKKNIQTDIIKTILGYPLIAALEMLRKWKVTITSVEQKYEYIESWQDYKTGTGTIYRERDISINIGKAKDNFDKDGKPKCFNCNVYEYMIKNCRKPKKEWDTKNTINVTR